MINKIARIISFVFSPLLVPTYGVGLALSVSTLNHIQWQVRVGVVAVTFMITCVVPLFAICGLWKLGLIKDPALNERTERTVPFVIAVLSYGACTVYLYKAHAPVWMVGFMAGAVAATIISLVVNRWWKISAHAAGMGGLLAMVFRITAGGYAAVDMLWPLVVVVLLTGMVATSRIGLQRHTEWQVMAGGLNGFICVYLLKLL